MRTIMLDTNAYNAFKQGQTEVVEVLAAADTLLLSSTVVGELLAGFAAGTRESKNRAELSRFMNSPRVETVSVTSNTADSYALVYASLRRKCKPIPTNDMWIAASALEHAAGLLTLDGHFTHVEGLHQGTRLDDFLP
jgi:tRNA(fMet)-specific endonuclease VapC